MKTPTIQKQIRCAIYTRKSTEEGLELEFNSLDAQRESAEAYIASQRHEGWICLPDRYDDGGYTGGNMERPGVRRLMDDITLGKVDALVVYKVDRLSRSLLDFAKIMEVLDKKGVSFVSVTQQFNTTNSMGRLTLNILLSFAQFEREIIAERTRDKMGAARRKGKWIGGSPFLGYDIDPRGRALVVNPAEAERVRQIFNIYLETQSLSQTVAEANARGWTMKKWTNTKGKEKGGARFKKSSMHGLLTNLSYIGKVDYKGEVYDAEVAGILEPELFHQVQNLLRENARCSGSRVRNKNGALLKGIIRCPHCDAAMVHQYTRKGPKLYRYYVCNKAMKEGWHNCPAPSLPAAEVEDFVVQEIRKIGEDEDLQVEVLRQFREQQEQKRKDARLRLREAQAAEEKARLDHEKAEAPARRALLERIENLAAAREAIQEELVRMVDSAIEPEQLQATLRSFTPAWDAMTQLEKCRMLRLLLESISYHSDSGEMAITFRSNGIGGAK